MHRAVQFYDKIYKKAFSVTIIIEKNKQKNEIHVGTWVFDV